MTLLSDSCTCTDATKLFYLIPKKNSRFAAARKFWHVKFYCKLLHSGKSGFEAAIRVWSTYGLLLTGTTEIFSDKYPSARLFIINPMLTVLESNVGIRSERWEEHFVLLCVITWVENSGRQILIHTALVEENNVL
jgi:hypothetical protein